MDNKEKFAVLSLSGGMDSSTLALRLIEEGYKVYALGFNYSQKHRVELERAVELNLYLTGELRELAYSFRVIDLRSLAGLLKSTLISGGGDVPEGHYQEESMKDTVVPNRNKIFSSIIQAVALSIQNENPDSEVVIAMGIHSGDHSIYPDCRQEFRDIDYQAFVSGNWGAEKIKLYTPYLDLDKKDILKDGERICHKLGFDFDEVYKRTNTSYKPIYDHERDIWYSDYKSSSSVERIEAFMEIDRVDPVVYAEELSDGSVEVVSWEEVCNFVKKTRDAQN